MISCVKNGGNQYLIGDVLIRFGKVYKIFKIKQQIINDQKQKVVFYKLLYSNKVYSKIIYSIPVANLSYTKIRGPLTHRQMSNFLLVLTKKSRSSQIIDFKKIKDIFYSEDIEKKAQIIRKLWLEKKKSNNNFSFTKKQLLETLVDSIKEELAYVFKISPQEAEVKIQTALESVFTN